ncbi:hypothetical protein [Tissierella praeacuta]|uniref:hypothetical protein n=1 Tax=Tissierella praeacuta TaxID=43131 RepID=UPI00333F7864
MADIKLADGKSVKEIRIFRNGRWVKAKGKIFYNSSWIEFSRPVTQFQDNTITIQNGKLLSSTAIVESKTIVFDTKITFNIKEVI